MRGRPGDAWEAACLGAERQVLEQLEAAFGAARAEQGVRVAAIASRVGLSARQLRNVRRGYSRPTLGQLLGLAEAHGLELDIRVRAKRTQVSGRHVLPEQMNQPARAATEGRADGE